MDFFDDMVNKFLSWPLPKDFSPDGGISFQQPSNKANWPIGTNLLTADQAMAMILHMMSEHTVYEMRPVPSAKLPGGCEAD